MKPKAPIFTFALALLVLPAATAAQAQAPPSPVASARPTLATGAYTPLAQTPGETLLRNAVQELARHTTVAAKLRQQINLFGHQIIGSGTYLQQGRGVDLRLRMDLKLTVSERLASLQQVSDGKSFWVRSDGLEPSSRTTCVDLDRVRHAIQRKELAGAAAAPGGISIGGLPRLLESIDGAFRFGTVAEQRLDRLAVWRIEGTWERAKLAELLPAQAERLKTAGAPDLSKLPEHLPDCVRLLLGKDDLFPYRIEYLRTRASEPGAGGPTDRKLLVLMELFEVQTNLSIDPRNFVYRPAKFVDATGEFLKKAELSEPATATTPSNKVAR